MMSSAIASGSENSFGIGVSLARRAEWLMAGIMDRARSYDTSDGAG
jgi:hypothetical protein